MDRNTIDLPTTNAPARWARPRCARRGPRSPRRPSPRPRTTTRAGGCGRIRAVVAVRWVGVSLVRVSLECRPKQRQGIMRLTHRGALVDLDLPRARDEGAHVPLPQRVVHRVGEEELPVIHAQPIMTICNGQHHASVNAKRNRSSPTHPTAHYYPRTHRG